MPKVIVYVPAAAWRRLEERGLDPASTVREFAKRGYELENGQLPERVKDEGSTRGLVTQDRNPAMAHNQPSVSRSGSCPMNVPRGTKCKSCGKVHT